MAKKGIVITVGIIINFLVSSVGISQLIETDIVDKKLSYFISQEDKLGSKIFVNSANHISGKGIAQPVIYEREEENLPNLLVYYFYYESDSTIDYILYEWDEINFIGYDSAKVKSREELNFYVERFKILKKGFVSKFGESEGWGSIDEEKIESGSFVRSDEWNRQEKTNLDLSISITNHVKEDRFSMHPYHRIRLYVKNPPKRESSSLPAISDSLLTESKLLLDLLLENLKNEKIEKIREFFSETVNNQISEEQIKALRREINFDKKLNLFYYGYQANLNMDYFLVLFYNYDMNTGSEIKEGVKLILDVNNEVVGLQTFKMQ